MRSSLHAVPDLDDYIPVTVRRSSHGKSAKKWFHRHRWTNKSKISGSPINRSDRRWDFNAFSEPEQSDDKILEEEEKEEESQGEFVVKKKKMKRERVVASKGAVKARQKTRTSMNMSLRHRTGSEKGEKRFSVYIYIWPGGPHLFTTAAPTLTSIH